jgi:tetratricopeptide (TPR) repeat protein
MKPCAGALIVLLGLGFVAANVVAPTKSELEVMYAGATKALKGGNISEALKQLDAIDARQPDMAAAKNLRGVALMRIGEYGLAEKALQKASELDPGLWEARFNLAEIPFLRKNWPEARRRFEALAAAKSEQAEGANGDLIRFKILLTYLLEGKEKKALEIVDRLQTSSTSPAYYCGKAAVALRHKQKPEAAAALKSAEKSFSPTIYKLFLESFYEAGLMEKPEGAVPVALEVASRADLVERAQEKFAKAEQAYRQREYQESLQLLDQVDATASNQAVSLNLRGKILLAQGEDSAAETALQNAVADDPQFLEARYNLARIPFRKREYDSARKELEAILGAISGSKQQRQWEQLIRYQIFLTVLLEGRDGPAQKALDEFKMMDETPALYYGQAAWAFQHNNAKLGNTWIANARNLFPEDLNADFAVPFGDLGWSDKAEIPNTARQVALQTEPTPTMQNVVTTSPSKEEPKPKATPATITQEKKSKSTEASSNRPRKSPGSASSKSEDSARTNQNPAVGATATPAPSPRPIASTVASSPPPAPEPEHQNLGDKVRRLILYPFKQRNNKAQSAAVDQSKPSQSPSPQPTQPKN